MNCLWQITGSYPQHIQVATRCDTIDEPNYIRVSTFTNRKLIAVAIVIFKKHTFVQCKLRVNVILNDTNYIFDPLVHILGIFIEFVSNCVQVGKKWFNLLLVHRDASLHLHIYLGMNCVPITCTLLDVEFKNNNVQRKMFLLPNVAWKKIHVV